MFCGFSVVSVRRKSIMSLEGYQQQKQCTHQMSVHNYRKRQQIQHSHSLIATMLPSKQTFTGLSLRLHHKKRMMLATLVKRPAVDFPLHLQNYHRDLFTYEDGICENVEKIKTLIIPMVQKRRIKMQVLSQQRLCMDGSDDYKWQKKISLFTNNLHNWYSKIELWQKDMKLIEGHYGNGVKAYFQFLKWLFCLNIMILLLILPFIVVPAIFMEISSNSVKINACAAMYNKNITTYASFNLLDLFQGTGYMEKTFFFYGSYPTSIQNFTYNLPLAYLLTTIACLLISLLSIIKTAAKGFRERLVINEGAKYHVYCNSVFAGWDFCIHNEKAAVVKHKAIYNDLSGYLELENLEKQRKRRTKNFKKIVMIRIFVNIIVLFILAGCGYGIYYVFQETSGDISESEQQISKNRTNHQNWVFKKLLYEFLPSITIVSMNMIIPLLFEYLITFETYIPLVTIRLTLIRTVFLRLASLIVLYVSLYKRVTNRDGALINECVCNDKYSKILCCETIVGQQIYKLLLTDFATQIITTLCINYFRHWLAENYKAKFFKFIGEQNFNLPRHVLDVVYTQSLCWLGCFYAPLLSALVVIFSFITFYLKKFACIVNSKPSAVIYRVSRSNSMFMVVTLISYMIAVLPVIYSIGLLEPSKSCGPFRELSTAWEQIDYSIINTHPISIEIVKFFYTPGFVVPFFILLVLLLYYYTAVSNANRHMINVLKKQLVLEGQDKRFLLDRLDKFLK